GAGVLYAGVVERLAGVVDPGLTLVKRVVGRGVARVPAGGLDPVRERRWGVEDRIAGRWRRGHRGLDVADPEVGGGDVGPQLLELSTEVVVRPAAERQRPFPDQRMDQEIATRRDREVD